MSNPPTEGGLEWALGELTQVWSRQFDAVQSVLQHGSAELLHSFSRIHALQSRWESTTANDGQTHEALAQELHEASEQALHGLQFADRLTQMLGVLQGDVDRLRRDIANLREADPDTVRRWLDELAAHYTTDEQRERHGAPGAVLSTDPGQAGVDFF